MVIPVGERFAQQLYLLEKKNGQLKESVTLPVRFVPMPREPQKTLNCSRFLRKADTAVWVATATAQRAADTNLLFALFVLRPRRGEVARMAFAANFPVHRAVGPGCPDDDSIRMSTSSVVRTNPFRATATPPTMMNLISARASFANNFSYGVSIVR